jgi:hypothetical protein
MPLILEFFTHITRDRDAYEAYIADRDGCMKKFGLNEDQCRYIRDAFGRDVSHPAIAKLENEMAKEHQQACGAKGTAASTFVLSMTTKHAGS